VRKSAQKLFTRCERRCIKTLKTPFLTIAFSFVFAFALARNASANLVQNGNFTRYYLFRDSCTDNSVRPVWNWLLDGRQLEHHGVQFCVRSWHG